MKARFYPALLILVFVAAAVGAQTPVNDLSTEEIDGLLLMREEEKLARDVYLTLAETWNLRIFENIAGSEQNHMDRMAGLLETYGVDDPVVNEASIGVFADPVLDGLYKSLVDRGMESRYEALLVGQAIEELDIDDLEELMAQTGEQEILLVYGNLLRGSENHLNAFNRQLERY